MGEPDDSNYIGIELVLGDSLEETLSCDDIFLEYFNVFLSLPAFPQRLCYSRFTGTFHDLNVEKVPIAPIRQESESSANADRKENELFDVQGGVGSKTSVYAAKEDEKERVMKWAKEYRLPLFEETRMYRELKLCKLLLRPLDLRRGSSRIRGYSRLSMGFATTTSLVSGTGRMESPSRALTSLENQSIDEWPGSSKYEETTQSRPTSRTFSLPPTLGRDKNWSAAAIYDTSGTTNSRTVQGENDPGHSVRPRTHKRRHPLTTPSSRPQPISQTSKTNFFSDSGLGTAAMDYAQSVGTSVKTRNIATRADTLGVDSRWESEEDYDTKTPNSQIRTILTSATYQDDNYSTPPSAYIWNKGKYEGKSALRTADSPSKPHRATIVLPKTSTNPTVRILTESTGENETSETTLTSSETKQNGFDDETLYDNANDDLDDFDDDVNDYLDFDDQESSCEETETEIATIEKVHSMSMQHIKERIFRTKSGMDSFLRFLQGTAGESLVDFWFDTESFKKSVKKFGDLKRPLTPNLVAAPDDYNQENDALASLRVRRHRLFRHILERHKFLLTEEAREQIRFAQANDGLSHQVFSRTQYDVLRRLRSYWLPRFVIHKNSDPSFKNRLVSGFWDDDDAFSYNPQINILSISSLPAFSIGYLTFHDEMRDTGTNLSVLTLESATTQVIAAAPTRPSTSQMRQMSARSASYHSVMRALVAEAEAGFPLRNYLRNNENRSLANTYDFLMSLEYLTKLTAGKFQSKSQNERSSQAGNIQLRTSQTLVRNCKPDLIMKY